MNTTSSQDVRDNLFSEANSAWEKGQLKKALSLFKRAAVLGDSGAQHNLGYFYEIGLGVRKNRVMALHWYRRAFRKGSRIAASNIAAIKLEQKEIKAALNWYARAAELGDGDAYVEGAKILLECATAQKKQRALGLLRRALRAAPSDITISGREEAKTLLRKCENSRNQ